MINLPNLTHAQIKTFWARVTIKSENECWPWKEGSSLERPRVWFDGISFIASRIAFLIEKENPKENLVCHSCDNERCCNPNHLFIGTHKQNSSDASFKGRLFGKHVGLGEKQHLAILNDESVKHIRFLGSLGLSTKELAVKYNVTRSTIIRVINRKTWKHLV